MSATHNGVRSTYSKSSGKWYWEITIDSGTTHFVGVATKDADLNTFAGGDAYSWGYHDLDGKKYSNGGGFSFGDTYVAGDVIGVALDLDNNEVWFSKNGVWQDSGIPADGTDEAFSSIPDEEIFAIWSGYDAGEVTANFGDSSFSYDVPTGFIPMSSGASTIIWDEDYLGSEVFLSVDQLTVSTEVSMSGGSVDEDMGSTIATTGKTSGKWYWEVTVSRDEAHSGTVTSAGDLPSTVGVGVSVASVDVEAEIGDDANGFEYNITGSIRNDGSSQSYGDTWEQGDVIGVALDLDNNKIWFSKNGVWQNSGDPEDGTNKAFTLPSVTFYPAGTAAGIGYAVLGTNSWGNTIIRGFSRVNAELTANFGDSDFSYTPPTGFLAYNSVSQTYEVTLSETVTTEDSYSRETEYGSDPPADHYGETSETVTTSDYFYAELPGDTEDPASGHIGESFTVSASIIVETEYKELDEETELSDEFTLDSPYRELDEEVTLSDDISAIFDPAYLALDEDVTTADVIEAPIYGDLDEDVTTAEVVSRIIEATRGLNEGFTTSEVITASGVKTETITESLALNEELFWGWGKVISDSVDVADTVTPAVAVPVNEVLEIKDTVTNNWTGTEAVGSGLGLLVELVWGWGKVISDTVDVADTVTPAVAVPVNEVFGIRDTVTNNWTGTEAVGSGLGLLVDLIVGEIFNETASDSIVVTDTISSLAQMISAISESITLTDTNGNKVAFNPVIAEAMTINGVVGVLANFYNTNSESLVLTDAPGVGWGKTINESLVLTDTVTPLWYCMNILTEDLTLTETALGQFQIDDTISETISFAASVAMQAVLNETVEETINFGIVVELDDELWECWVLSTNAFHASVYSGFDFNSYANFNNTAYGCKTDGIYTLSGDTDNEEDFVAGVVFPDTYFGTRHRKRFRAAYFGLSGGTTPALKVTTDSGTKTYTITDSKARMTRDMYGKKWVLKVEDFDSLDFVELVPIILAR